MDNKFNNMLNEFFANIDAKSDEELNEKLKEFIAKYNNGEIDYTNTILDDAYELLVQAENAKTKNQAIKLAKEAYDMCPDCFDAVLFQAELEENSIKRDKLLNEGLEFEKDRLEEEGYFEKDNIGHFYGIFETRPYIRGLYRKADYLIADGKAKQARDVCLEILRLNNNDNTGARYLLMAIYAYLEDEKEMLKLYKKYPEESLVMLFPQFIVSYKLGKDKEAKELLERINKVNTHFIKFFKGTMKRNEDIPYRHYSHGDSSEVIMYFEQYDFLVMTLPNIHEFILENSKKSKKIN